jgi:glutamine synthetase
MCDCYTPQGKPIPTNKRHNAAKIFSNPDVVAEEPWYVAKFIPSDSLYYS